MSFSSTLKINASGLTAQRLRMDVIANNLANVNTTRTDEGGPFKRKLVVFRPMNKPNPFIDINSLTSYSTRILGPQDVDEYLQGVKAVQITDDQTQGKLSYEPGHPDANEEGYVEYPNINVVTEMVDMISASRSYEANVTAISTTKAMAIKALEIGRA